MICEEKSGEQEVRNSNKNTNILSKLESEESEANRRPSLLANVMMGCFGGSASKNDAEEDKRRKEANKRIEKQIQKDKQIYRATHRLLLLGMTHHFGPQSGVYSLLISLNSLD